MKTCPFFFLHTAFWTLFNMQILFTEMQMAAQLENILRPFPCFLRRFIRNRNRERITSFCLKVKCVLKRAEMQIPHKRMQILSEWRKQRRQFLFFLNCTWKSWSSMPKRSRRFLKTCGQYSLNLNCPGRFSLRGKSHGKIDFLM